MLKYIFRFFAIVFLLIHSSSTLLAQEERKVSLSVYGGAAFFLKNKTNNADLSTRVLGGFKPTPLAGLGVYYKLSQRFYIGENYLYLFSAKIDNRKLSSHTFRTTLKYYILANKKLNPYITGSLNVNMLTLKRSYSERVYIPDAGSNAIGAGIQLDSVHYREKSLKLSNLPVLGGSIGAGFEFRINKRFNVFAEYNLHANLGKKNDLIQQYYFSNQSNFMFQTVTAGINIKLFKPQKQLLAVLTPDSWRNSKPIDVKGTIIYKNTAKPYNKVLPVERTDTLEAVQEVDPTDETGLVFFSRGIEMGHYQFMLPRKKRRIIRADLQILNYNKIDIEDEEVELEMVEDEVSENILSRDANFAVLLREGFQHEVELMTTAENIGGTVELADTTCRVRIVLRDQYDSIIAYQDTLENKAFNFVDVKPGTYKVTFQRLNNECTRTEFRYAFTGALPYITSQSNTDLPEDTTASYSIQGNVQVSPTKKEAPKGTTSKLIDPTGRVESTTSLGGPKTDFNYRNLPSSDFSAVYEDPSDKASMMYTVKDRKANVIREVKQGPSKKAAKGPVIVKGKVELPNPAQASTVSVLLVDSTGKIRQKAPLQADGSFSFNDLAKNKYKVAYESTDPAVRGKLNYNVTDKSVKLNKIVLPELTSYIEEADTIHFSKQPLQANDSTGRKVIVLEPASKEKPVTNKTGTPIEKKTPRKEVPIRYPFTEFKPNTTYNDQGYEVKPVGYGVQISSFFINSNLEKFCQRVRAKGEKNIFIQVIYKDKNNPAAGLIYRVILGADEDKEKMLKRVPAYMDKGYDAVLRKHLN
ncbi:MAG TPA: SPOR domain-containing protein [Cytophagaceae bacterium]|nr:SPOR domain-containing protein [Cytophagaceae bacterium]